MLPYFTTGITFLVLDGVWLGIMSGRFYRPELGALMRTQIALPPVIAFYIIYVGVLTTLVVIPAAAANNPARAFIQGALFGLAAYATYNFTNAATLNGWPKLLTFVDLAWGTIATGLAAYVAVLSLRAIGHSS